MKSTSLILCTEPASPESCAGAFLFFDAEGTLAFTSCADAAAASCVVPTSMAAVRLKLWLASAAFVGGGGAIQSRAVVDGTEENPTRVCAVRFGVKRGKERRGGKRRRACPVCFRLPSSLKVILEFESRAPAYRVVAKKEFESRHSSFGTGKSTNRFRGTTLDRFPSIRRQ